VVLKHAQLNFQYLSEKDPARMPVMKPGSYNFLPLKVPKRASFRFSKLPLEIYKKGAMMVYD
jgi:hypothetical protein